MRRYAELHGPGRLLVSTDLHGNLEDFLRLREIWERERASGRVYWTILGDLVHGPDEDARRRFAALYDYDDRSEELVDEVSALIEAHPTEVGYVLGNHDHAHLGGPTTRKFHSDEAAFLEARMSDAQRHRLRRLFGHAMLLVTTSCGVTLAHGAPPDCLRSPTDLDGIRLRCVEDRERSLVLSMTTAYGQPRDVMQRFLASVSRPGFEQRLMAHGHDKAEEGYFTEHYNQVCPVLFGALRENKRYLLLDLDARYADASSLREGIEVRRLYPEASAPQPDR